MVCRIGHEVDMVFIENGLGGHRSIAKGLMLLMAGSGLYVR